jgi:hypothetical protein
MTNIPRTQATDGVPTYLRRGDPDGRFADYQERRTPSTTSLARCERP